jgi:flagellar L-ring protein precursor FlgH
MWNTFIKQECLIMGKKPTHKALASGIAVLSLGFLLSASGTAQAESLYRASAQTSSFQQPLASRSLFTPPISRQVGDMVIIQIDETTQQDVKSELKVTSNHTLQQNGTSIFNRMVRSVLGKLPVNTTGISNTLSVPDYTGLNNANTMDNKAESTQQKTYKDNVGCQVVQVLPNGDLMIQGEKVVMYNKERQNLIVSGIVKPYYLDRFNQISSKMVGNFQMLQSGKGTISRQQNDGFMNKIYQFVN